MAENKGKNTQGAEAKSKGAATGQVPVDDSHVPEEAENFEHTLRRLTVEKQKSRKGSFGLYR